jgi:hypothetical protein
MTDTTTPTDTSAGQSPASGESGLSLAERVSRLEHLMNIHTAHGAQMHGALTLMVYQRSVDVMNHIRATDDPESSLTNYIDAIRKSAANLQPPPDGDADITALVQAGITGALHDHITALRALAIQPQGGWRLQS